MKIECLIKRPGGTKAQFPDWPNDTAPEMPEAPAAQYHFKPIDAEDPNSPHVADVTNAVHRDRFLTIGDAYRVFEDGAALAAPPKREPKPAKTEVQAPPPPDGVDPLQVAEVRGLSVAQLKSKINTYAIEVLKVALDEEQKRTDEKPRKSWIEVVEGHIGAGNDDD